MKQIIKAIFEHIQNNNQSAFSQSSLHLGQDQTTLFVDIRIFIIKKHELIFSQQPDNDFRSQPLISVVILYIFTLSKIFYNYFNFYIFYLWNMISHRLIIQKEEMLKNTKTSFVIKHNQNKLKIDDYKPHMMTIQKDLPFQSKKNTNQIRKRQLSLPYNYLKQMNSRNHLKLPKTVAFTKKDSENENIQSRKKFLNIENCSRKTLRSISSTLLNKKGSTIQIKIINKQNIYEDAIIQKEQALEKNVEQLDSYLEEIIKVMSKKYMLNINSGIIKIKKGKMIWVLMMLTRTMLSLKKYTIYNTPDITIVPPELIQVFDKIKNLRNIMINDKSSKLKIHSASVNKMVLLNDIDQKTEFFTKKISDFIEEEKQLKQKNQLLKQEFQQRQSFCNNIKAEVEKIQETIYNAKIQHQVLHTKNQELIKNINELQKNFDQLQAKGSEIFLFVQKQKQKPFFNKVSVDYKKMQSEMFDYAYQLIAKPQIIKYKWEPQPFEAVQKLIQSDMKRTLERIGYDNISLETKIKEMRQLIIKSMKHLKFKDQELGSIFKKKTDAINRFADIIHNWHQEHILKNHYLSNMRQEYAIDSTVVQECISNLEKYELKEDQKNNITKLRKYWNWVHLAFLYGNSFY